MSSRRDFDDDGGFLSEPPAVFEPVDEDGGFDSGFWESCLMVSPPCVVGPWVGGGEEGPELGGPVLTSRFPLSCGSSGTLMVSPPTLSDIAGNYIPSAGTPARAKPRRDASGRPFRPRRPSGRPRGGRPSRRSSTRCRSRRACRRRPPSSGRAAAGEAAAASCSPWRS